jgi:hypothetical protein
MVWVPLNRQHGDIEFRSVSGAAVAATIPAAHPRFLHRVVGT